MESEVREEEGVDAAIPGDETSVGTVMNIIDTHVPITCILRRLLCPHGLMLKKSERAHLVHLTASCCTENKPSTCVRKVIRLEDNLEPWQKSCFRSIRDA